MKNLMNDLKVKINNFAYTARTAEQEGLKLKLKDEESRLRVKNSMIETLEKNYYSYLCEESVKKEIVNDIRKIKKDYRNISKKISKLESKIEEDRAVVLA